MQLTARQIKGLDETSIDKKTADLTLDVALKYHSNCANERIKKEREFWDEIKEMHNLDRDKVWTIKSIDGSPMIVEKTAK